MKKLPSFFVCLCLSVALVAQSVSDQIIPNPYAQAFQKAYFLHPSVPKGLLEAVAFTQSRFVNLAPTAEPSCIGYPQTYGLMGLVEDGKGYFRNNLLTVAQLSGFSADDIKALPATQALAYAKAVEVLQQQNNIYGNDLNAYKPIFLALSELPLQTNAASDFALNAHLYQLYWFLSQGEFQDAYNFPDYRIDLKAAFGSNYQVLKSASVNVSPNQVVTNSGIAYSPAQSALSVVSTDYGPALWNAAASCNYSSRSGTAITAVAIHDVEGTYAGCISWFQNCSAQASAHYVLRSSDGQVTQMVLESNKAWHVGSENPYTVGLEHEGYNNNASWYTNAMYQSSADLVRDICAGYSINTLRCYFGPGCSGSTAQCGLGVCTKIKGHQMFPNQTHNDPGPYWNWEKYYKLINNAPTVTTVTTTTGNFYDSGGAGANYSNDERKLWLFQPANATAISMNFSVFNLENNYDYMLIYDGNSVNAPLLGKYTSTNNPGPVISSGGSLLVEFRSDCATTNPGWAATYTANISTPSSPDNVAPSTSVSTSGAWQTGNFTATFTDVDNVGGSGIEKGYYQVIDYNGTEWRGNFTHGFLADNFDNAIHAEWTQKVGTWGINSNALRQSDETSTAAGNTNIYAKLTQNLSNRYLYHFLMKMEGTGTNRRAGFHFFCDAPDSVNRGNSYFVWFRLDGTQQVQIYKTNYTGGVNTFGSPTYTAAVSLNAGQWYDVKTIYDRVTGKMAVYLNNARIAQWTDASPLSNGGYVSFRSGNCAMSVDEVKIYRSRASTALVTVGSGNANDIRYQNPGPTQNSGKVKSICQDSAGNLSPIFYYDVNIDWTEPSGIAMLNDGRSADLSQVAASDSLSANWSSSADPHSALARYWYSIGTAPGATNVQNWTSNWGDTSVTVHGLTLVSGEYYYFNVKAEDGAGLFSPVVSSNGQQVSTSIPTSVQELDQTTGLRVFPNPFSNEIVITLKLDADADLSLVLTDVLGRRLSESNTHEHSGDVRKTLETAPLKLAPGIYWLTVSINGKAYTQKLIRE